MLASVALDHQVYEAEVCLTLHAGGLLGSLYRGRSGVVDLVLGLAVVNDLFGGRRDGRVVVVSGSARDLVNVSLEIRMGVRCTDHILDGGRGCLVLGGDRLVWELCP